MSINLKFQQPTFPRATHEYLTVVRIWEVGNLNRAWVEWGIRTGAVESLQRNKRILSFNRGLFKVHFYSQMDQK